MTHSLTIHSQEELDALFDAMDTDGSGSVDFKEMNKMLRQGASVQLAADLQVDA